MLKVFCLLAEASFERREAVVRSVVVKPGLGLKSECNEMSHLTVFLKKMRSKPCD